MANSVVTVGTTPSFGTTTTVGSYVVESFNLTHRSDRKDVEDGDGIPTGAVIVPKQDEFTATVQATGSAPDVTDTITIGAATYYVTESTLVETQADFQRFNLSGFRLPVA